MTNSQLTYRRLLGALMALSLGLGGGVIGCDEGFPDFNEVEGFRVLALRADPPAIVPGETTTLQALVYFEGNVLPPPDYSGDAGTDGGFEQDPDDPVDAGVDPDMGAADDEAPAPPTYRWTWCPFRLPISEGGDCYYEDEAAFRQALGDLVVLPEDLSFDLGSGPTAELDFVLPALLLEVLCDPIETSSPSLAGLFGLECNGGFPLSVELQTEYDGQTISVLKDVFLQPSPEADYNTENPTLIDEVSYKLVEDQNDFGQTDIVEEGALPLTKDGTVELELGESYGLWMNLEDDSAQLFTPLPTEPVPNPEPRRETLFVTWFVTSGDTQYRRTTRLDGKNDPALIRENVWNLPLKMDEDAEEAQLFLVLRDERGGQDWLSRKVRLVR